MVLSLQRELAALVSGSWANSEWYPRGRRRQVQREGDRYRGRRLHTSYENEGTCLASLNVRSLICKMGLIKALDEFVTMVSWDRDPAHRRSMKRSFWYLDSHHASHPGPSWCFQMPSEHFCPSRRRLGTPPQRGPSWVKAAVIWVSETVVAKKD